MMHLDPRNTDFDTDFLKKTRAWYAAGERDVDSPCSVTTWGYGVAVYDRIDPAGPRTRLYYASVNGWLATMRWLIDHGADINFRIPPNGKSTLHAALSHGGFDAANMLLDAGARVDAVDDYGFTPLHVAVNTVRFSSQGGIEHIALCKRLLSLGASLYEKNNGETPETYARRCRSTQVVNLLADVRSAGGWAAYIAAPRAALLALRRELAALRESGHATAPSSVPAHERLFFQASDDVFSHIIAFWRSDRDL